MEVSVRYQIFNAIKKGCSTQSIIGLASDLLEILCSHRENKKNKKQRLQHEITKVVVFLMPIFRTGKTVLHQGNENTVSRWNYVCTRV